MPLPIWLVGPGDRIPAAVDDAGALCVTERGIPSVLAPGDDPVVLFRQDFTDDGTSTGSADFLVDGTAAGNQDFWIPAHATRDIFIRSVSWIIADGGSSLSEFAGTGAVLGNGIRFFWTRDTEEIDIHPAIIKNLDLVRMGGEPAFGDGNNAFLAGGLSDIGTPVSGYMPVIDMEKLFGMRWGLRLRAGTNQKIIVRIQDDLSGAGIDEVGAIAYGLCRIPDPKPDPKRWKL